MKIICRIAFIVAAFIFINSCSGPKNSLYTSENLSTTGFSNYKTYGFIPTRDTAYTKIFDKKMLEALMSQAVIKELRKKDMTLDTTKPDCFFTYRLIANRTYKADQEQEVIYSPDVYIPAFDNDARVYTFSSDNRPVTYAGNLTIDTLREGSLVINMVDAKENKVVWRTAFQGKGKETFQQPTPETVNDIIHQMFKTFPKK